MNVQTLYVLVSGRGFANPGGGTWKIPIQLVRMLIEREVEREIEREIRSPASGRRGLRTPPYFVAQDDGFGNGLHRLALLAALALKHKIGRFFA